METKGTAVIATRDFVKTRHGEEGLQKLMKSLDPDTAKSYSRIILSNNWFDLQKMLVEPSVKISELFYNNDKKVFWEIGRHSADHGLKGIYRLFVKVGSPQFILSKAGSILPTYYNPSEMEGEVIDKNKFSVRIIKFEKYSDVVEMRIGGWIEKALEICGCKNIKIEIPKSFLKKDDHTQYLINWD